MHVLHLSPAEQVGSGVSHYARLFREALAREGVALEVVEPGQERPNSLTGVRAYSRAAVAASARCDVVHAELGGGSLREFYALRAVQRPRARPCFATLHDPPRAVWWPFQFSAVSRHPRVAGAAARVTSGLAERLERETLEACRALFVLTRAGAASLSRVRVPSIHVIEHVARAEVPFQPPPPGPGLVLGSFGYWYRGKGLDLLVEALAVLRDEEPPVRLTLWGDLSASVGLNASESYRREIEHLIARRGLAEHVSLAGRLPEEDVASHLSGCDAIVLPFAPLRGPLRELRSTSGAMFRAFSAGVPVVAARVRALDETLVEGENGLMFEPGDLNALLMRLRRLRDDPALRVRLRAGAEATALRFSNARIARQVVDVYRAATASS